MGNNITTCLTAFDQGWRFVYMIIYIYVPVSIPVLRVILDTSGLSCTSQLTVYEPISKAGDQSELYYQECGLVEKRDIDGLVQQCEFLCLCPIALMVNVGVRETSRGFWSIWKNMRGDYDWAGDQRRLKLIPIKRYRGMIFKNIKGNELFRVVFIYLSFNGDLSKPILHPWHLWVITSIVFVKTIPKWYPKLSIS